MDSLFRHRWPSRRHRGIFFRRRIQGAGGGGRTINMEKGVWAVNILTVPHSDVFISFPPLLETLRGAGRTIFLGADAHMNE